MGRETVGFDQVIGAIEEHFEHSRSKGRSEDRALYTGEVDELTEAARTRAAVEVAAGLDTAGWSGSRAAPLLRPTLPFDPIAHGPGYKPTGPVVVAVRRLWLARYNPFDPRWRTRGGRSGSDVAAPGAFGWDDPASAVAGGNYWLSTAATPNNRAGIEQIEAGDLVVVQRSSPGTQAPKSMRNSVLGNDDLLYGLAAAWQVEGWDDARTGRWERRVGLLPLAPFTYPVARRQLRTRGRLRSDRFKTMRQLVDGTGGLGYTVFPVTDDRDINELLAVCGLSPEVLTEPDMTVVAARVAATKTGDKALWRLRWDNRYRHQARRRHERAAVVQARAWAQSRGYVYCETVERVPLAGCDLLFVDPALPAVPLPGSPLNPFDTSGRGSGVCLSNQVEVEVKGYAAASVNAVALQRSQVDRARSSVAGRTPPWWLYAVLRSGSRSPQPLALDAAQVVQQADRGALTVR